MKENGKMILDMEEAMKDTKMEISIQVNLKEEKPMEKEIILGKNQERSTMENG